MSPNKTKMGRAFKWLRKLHPSSETPLFRTVVFWVLFFAAVFWACGLLLTGQFLWFAGQISIDKPNDFFNLVTAVLATVGGIIVISYLVIKYRERSAQEREEISLQIQQIKQDFRAAIDQLGHDRAVVRIAGVYALVDISDKYGGQYNQRVVEVLCGYLRSERTSIGDDQAVESTIFRVIRQRTRQISVVQGGDTVTLQRAAPNAQLWSDCSFDLSGAKFVGPVLLHGSKFNGEVDFGGASFDFRSSFRGTKFYFGVNFAKASFHSSAIFTQVEFKSWCSFSETRFHQSAIFFESIFNAEADFCDTTFCRQADFKSATFYDRAHFRFAEFFSLSNFYDARFYSWSVFDGSKFHGETVFDVADFRKQAVFSKAAFDQEVSFTGSKFKIKPQFSRAKFNPQYKNEVVIPNDIKQKDGLPGGALWMTTEDDASA